MKLTKRELVKCYVKMMLLVTGPARGINHTPNTESGLTKTITMNCEINSISKEMGNNFASCLKVLMVLMFKDVISRGAEYCPPCENNA